MTTDHSCFKATEHPELKQLGGPHSLWRFLQLWVDMNWWDTSSSGVEVNPRYWCRKNLRIFLRTSLLFPAKEPFNFISSCQWTTSNFALCTPDTTCCKNLVIFAIPIVRNWSIVIPRYYGSKCMFWECTDCARSVAKASSSSKPALPALSIWTNRQYNIYY